MSCEKFQQLIALYVEGDLSEAEAHVVDQHVDECAGCREFAAGIEESQAALKQLRLECVSDSVFADVREQVLREVPALRSASLWPKYAIAAALVVALLAGLVWRVRRPVEPVQSQVAKSTVATVPPPVTTVAHRAPARYRAAARSTRVAQRAKHAPAFKSGPLVVKLLTDDPHVVIYWLVDQNGG